MLVLDANVVLPLHRRDHPDHEITRRWWSELLVSGETFAVPSAVWATLVRLATHRRVFVRPSTTPEVFGFVRAMTAQQSLVAAEPGPRHLALLEEICETAEVRADLVPDAVLAALAVEHGGGVATFDRDFARFDGLRVVRPGS